MARRHLALPLLLATLVLGCSPRPRAAPPQTPLPPRYETLTLPQAVVHLITIPDPVAYPLQVTVVDDLATVDRILAQVCGGSNCALAGLNAGFFDPQNGLTTSAVVVAGDLVADPRQNPRLMENPDLQADLDKILNRSEFRRYACDHQPRYAITPRQAPLPQGCQLVAAVGAGPQLLPENTGQREGFVDSNRGRDALGSGSPNARSAIGLGAAGEILLVMVAQRPGLASSGLTLAELAQVMAQRGAVQALNLDGGSSATLVYDGAVYHGRINAAGEVVKRPVKSILWVPHP